MEASLGCSELLLTTGFKDCNPGVFINILQMPFSDGHARKTEKILRDLHSNSSEDCKDVGSELSLIHQISPVLHRESNKFLDSPLMCGGKKRRSI